MKYLIYKCVHAGVYNYISLIISRHEISALGGDTQKPRHVIFWYTALFLFLHSYTFALILFFATHLSARVYILYYYILALLYINLHKFCAFFFLVSCGKKEGDGGVPRVAVPIYHSLMPLSILTSKYGVVAAARAPWRRDLLHAQWFIAARYIPRIDASIADFNAPPPPVIDPKLWHSIL